MLPNDRYFFFSATSASFESRYGLQESVERLRAVTKRTLFGSLTAQAAVGKVSEKRVSLQRSIPFVGNSFKPFFIGRFEQSERGTFLIGHFTMHWLVKTFMTFWFGFIVLWTVLALVGVLLSHQTDAWSFPAFGTGMLIFGVLLVQVGKWFARNDIAWLSDVINSALSDAHAIEDRVKLR